MKKILLLIYALLSVIALQTYSQTGPGGVGNQNGTSGQPANVLWLDADELDLSNGEDVATWTDISGNNNDASMSSSYKPSFRATGLNGKPCLYFNGWEYLIIGQPASLDFTPGTDEFSVFYVINSIDYGTVFSKAYSDAASKQYQFYMDNDGFLTARIGGTLSAGSTDYTGNDHIVSFITNTSNTDAWLDGNLDISSGSIGVATNSVDVLVGARRSNSDNTGYGYTFYGDIAEVIVYANEISEPQRVILENYLGAKYGLSIANDYYANTTYTSDLIGIGTDGSDVHSATSGSGGALYLEEASSSLDVVNEYLMAAHNGALNGATSDDIDASISYWRFERIWHIEKTGSIDAKIGFDLVEAGFSAPTDVNDYVLLYRADISDDFTELTAAEAINGDRIEYTIADANLLNGYYTLGVPQGKEWYTLIAGDWDNWEVWTLDPAGALPNNPDHLTPTTSPTAEYDNVHMLSGKPVTISTNNKNNAMVEVLGELILGTTTGHSFNTIAGNGRIIMEADNFPGGDATHFITKGMGEGIAVFQGTSYTISNAREFYDVEISLDNITDKITLTNDFTINGNFSIQTGEFQINDNSSTDVLNVYVNNNVSVDADGKVLVGSGDTYSTHSQYHQFKVQGNFTNYGIVKLTNRVAADYDDDDAGGAVELIFSNTAADQNMQCDNTTVLNQITIDKGNDETFILKIAATSTDNFKLYGRNDETFSGDPGERDGNKALRLLAGTVKLDLNIVIPCLAYDNSYDIDADARLWLNDANVTMPIGATPDGSNYLAIYGTLQSSSNSVFSESTATGTILRETGTIKVESGDIAFNNIRTSTWGASGDHVGSYMQSGGNVVINDDGLNTDYAPFHLPYQTNVFQMTGGTLTIETTQTNGGDADDFALIINSAEGNYNITGGTVIVDMNYNVPYQMTSRAPFYNFILRNSIDTDQTLTITDFNEISGDVDDVPALPLVVLGDLTIEQYCTLNTNGQDVEIVQDFNVEDGGVYTHGNGTLKFFGDYDGSQINIGDNSSEPGLTVYKLEIEKDQNANQSILDDIDLISAGRTNNTTALLIENDLLITRGELDVKTLDVELQGNMEIVDGNVLYDGATPGYIILNNTTIGQTLKGSSTEEQDFGNIELINSNGATLLSNVNVDKFAFNSGILNLDVYNFDIGGSLFKNTGDPYSGSLMFKTAGNASDGGLSLYTDFSIGGAGTETLFPIGTGTDYNPATVTQSTTVADDGKITINPVSMTHPSATDPSKTIPYYWVVDTADFSSVTYLQLKYTFTYNAGGMPSSVNKGLNLWTEDYTWYSFNSVNNDPDLTFPYEAYLTGDYTLGNKSEFNQPIIYYSRIPSSDYNIASMPQWSNKNTWSTDSLAGPAGSNPNSYPHDGDIAVIGYGGADPGDGGGNRHHVAYRASDNYTLAKVIIDASETAGVWPSRLFIEEGASIDMGVLDGDGTLEVRVDPSSPSTIIADMGDFVNSYTDGSRVLFHCESGANVELPSLATTLPNVRIEGGGARTVYFPEEVLILDELRIDYDATFRVEHDITINGDLRLGNYNEGILEFPDDVARTVNVNGRLRLTSDNASAITVDNSTPNGLEHYLRVAGNIELNQGNSVDLFTNNTGGNNVVLEIFGEDNADFTNLDNMPVELYRLEMNKLSSNVFTVTSDFNIGGPANSLPKAIELIGGELFLNNASLNIDINSGGDDFPIPADASLNITNGTLNVSATNYGIWLNSKLTIGDNGALLCNGGTNNYIEYTNSGNSEIFIEQGTLRVGSQIRRSMDSDEGILAFTQNKQNSTIIIGEDGTAPENNRGIFELTNDQCSFMQSEANSAITIACQQDNPQVPALYFKDLLEANVNIADGCSFIIGGATTPEDQIVGIYSNVNLKNIEVDNSSTNDPTAKLWTIPLTLDEDLVIDTDAEFDANGLALNIAGDMTNNGEFIASNNTTTFNGSATQNILGTGTTAFYNLTKSTATSFILGNDITVENVFDMDAGTLDDGDNTLTVKGNIDFGGIHTWGGSCDGIHLNGTLEQIMTGSGSYGKIVINNSNGVSIDPASGSDISVSAELALVDGIFDIDNYLLSIQTGADITTTTSFDANTMIQTNRFFADKGIKKFFPAISSTTSFTYPVGCQEKYTPLVLSIDAVDAGGSIRIAAADERQPTITDDNDECDEFDDTQNVLQYHWVLKADGITNFTADAYFNYYASDAIANNTFGYDTSDYIPARIKTFGDNTWNKYDYDEFEGGNLKINFEFNGTDDNGISGEYTAGIEQPSGCKGAIPDNVATYISVADGDWETLTTWDTYPVAGGDVPAGGPTGAIVIIDENDEVSVPNNYISCYKTEIKSGGTLNIGTTFGHRLGIVLGTGTLYVERGEIPAGDYNDFFSVSGGTLEYGGSTHYNILGGITEVNNLILSSSSAIYYARRFPNNNVIINGDLTIGTKAVPLQQYNREVHLKGDLTTNSIYWKFRQYNLQNIFIFDGDEDQTISGDYSTNANTNTSFANVTIDKSNGNVIIADAAKIEIERVLTLNAGIINNNGTGEVILSEDASVSGASSSSYINGPLYKDLYGNNSFEFPIGKSVHYRPIEIVNSSIRAQWVAEYSYANPHITMGLGVAQVSAVDYWSINDINEQHPEAHIKLTWGWNSGVIDGYEADLLVCELDGANTWQSKGNSSYSGNSSGGNITSLDASTFSEKFFTLASSSTDNALPIELLEFDVEMEGGIALIQWTTATEINNDYFVVERSANGVDFEELAIQNGAGNSNRVIEYSNYDYQPLQGISYYRLKQVDLDGQISYTDVVTLKNFDSKSGILSLDIYPNPLRNGLLSIHITGFEDEENLNIILSDAYGRVVVSQMINTFAKEHIYLQLDLKNKVPKGIYIVTGMSNGKSINKKLIVE